MADTLQAVYDALLLTHIREARNYGLLPAGDADCAMLDISNPLCGDAMQLQIHWRGARIAQLRFECECCGIAMGNASLMSEQVLGSSRSEAAALADTALALLSGSAQVEQFAACRPERLEAWQLLQAICDGLPARRTCASLGWQALQGLLAGGQQALAREIRRP